MRQYASYPLIYRTSGILLLVQRGHRLQHLFLIQHCASVVCQMDPNRVLALQQKEPPTRLVYAIRALLKNQTSTTIRCAQRFTACDRRISACQKQLLTATLSRAGYRLREEVDRVHNDFARPDHLELESVSACRMYNFQHQQERITKTIDTGAFKCKLAKDIENMYFVW